MSGKGARRLGSCSQVSRGCSLLASLFGLRGTYLAFKPLLALELGVLRLCEKRRRFDFLAGSFTRNSCRRTVRPNDCFYTDSIFIRLNDLAQA